MHSKDGLCTVNTVIPESLQVGMALKDKECVTPNGYFKILQKMTALGFHRKA